MTTQTIIWLVVIGIMVVLALPPALRERSLKRFFTGMALVFAIVVLPLFVFGLSCLMVPDWKGACTFGWVNCFLAGKIALAPLVLWAVAALYAIEVLRIVKRTAFWIVRGLMAGALVSTVCSIYGLIMIGVSNAICLWLLVPLYVAVWYSIRLVQVIRAAPLGWKDYLVAALGSVPFWIGSVVLSRTSYESLPDQPPSCFVVTAATRGHESVVGPFTDVNRNGRILRANRQLLTLWRFEALWQARARRSHAAFRRVYNFIGPVVARKIALPWLADVAYIGIKPAEFFAAVVLCAARISCESKNPNPN